MENNKDNDKVENEQSQNEEYLKFIKKMRDLGFDEDANMTEEEFKEYNRRLAKEVKELADGMGDLMSSLKDMLEDIADDDDDYDIDFDIDEENARCDQLIEDMDKYLASFDDDDDD